MELAALLLLLFNFYCTSVFWLPHITPTQAKILRFIANDFLHFFTFAFSAVLTIIDSIAAGCFTLLLIAQHSAYEWRRLAICCHFFWFSAIAVDFFRGFNARKLQPNGIELCKCRAILTKICRLVHRACWKCAMLWGQDRLDRFEGRRESFFNEKTQKIKFH